MLRAATTTRRTRTTRLSLQSLEQRANPSTFTVDDDLMQRPNADFTSIQAAIDAAGPGDSIRVYRGNYAEQIVIPAGKNGLKLFANNPCDEHGNSPGLAVIAPTAFTDPSQAVVRVAGSTNVEIRGFKITGEKAPGGTTNGADYGVLVDTAGSAHVRENRITFIRDNPLTGVQEGIGIQFGRTDGMGGILSSGSGTATKNRIDDYQKGGIVVIGDGSDAKIRQNRITGTGPTSTIGQNGVQVSNGATATIEHNRISKNNYTGSEVVAEGILVYQTKGVNIRHNEVSSNNEGVLIFQSSDVEVEHNWIRNNTYNGVGLFQATDNEVEHNLIANNGNDGINIDDSSDNEIEHNVVYGNSRYGIALEATAVDNVVRRNWVFDNDVGNIFVGNPDNVVNNNRFNFHGCWW